MLVVNTCAIKAIISDSKNDLIKATIMVALIFSRRDLDTQN